MSILSKRLDVHFAALAAVGAVAAIGATAQKAEAVIYSGLLNIAIPNTFDGLYINFSTNVHTTPSNNPGFDMNPYNSGTWNMFEGGGCTEIGVGTTFTDLAPGTLIDAAGAYINGNAFSAGYGSTSGGVLGFKFLHANGSTYFGWANLILPGAPGAPTGPGTLVDFAYEETGAGILAGNRVPAPTAGMAVLALGGMGLLGRRRK